MQNKIGLGVVVAGLSLAVLLPVVAGASSQPTFKMEIVAPECTFDTIDDGSGPVLVVTCPPGTVNTPDQDQNTESIEASNNIVASQRLYSPADTLSMLQVLESSGMVVDLPEGFDPTFQASDVLPNTEKKVEATTGGPVFTAAVVALVVGAIASAAVVSSFAFTASGLEVVRRLWSRWFH